MYGSPNHAAVQTASVAVGATTSDAVRITDAQRVFVEWPTISSYTSASTQNVFVQVCRTPTGTFRRLVDDCVGSSASGYTDMTIYSFAGNRHVHLPGVVGWDYMKLELTVSATAAMGMPVYIVS